MNQETFFELVAIAGLVIFSVLTAASETALLSFSRVRLRHLVEQGKRSALIIEKILERPERFFSSVLVGNTLVAMAASSLTTALVIRLLGFGWQWLAIALITILLVTGEITAKTICAHDPERAAHVLYPFVTVFMWFLRPLVWIFQKVAGLLAGLALGTGREKVSMITEDEIKMMISIGEEEGVLAESEEEMLHSVFEFADTTAKEIMVPRTDIVAIDVDSAYEDIMKIIVETGYSRLPVYKDNLDNILGIIHTKDLLAFWEKRDSIILRDTTREPYFVPDTKKISELLREFQKGHVHMAIVVDEYGGTEGLVTLEDCLEEIVGEIQDEYDIEAQKVEYFPDGYYLVDARISVKDLNDELGQNLLPEEKEFDSLGGFIMATLGRIPVENDQVTYKDYTFTVTRMHRRRVSKVRILPPPPPTPEPEAPPEAKNN